MLCGEGSRVGLHLSGWEVGVWILFCFPPASCADLVCSSLLLGGRRDGELGGSFGAVMGKQSPKSHLMSISNSTPQEVCEV